MEFREEMDRLKRESNGRVMQDNAKDQTEFGKDSASKSDSKIAEDFQPLGQTAAHPTAELAGHARRRRMKTETGS